MTQYYLYNRGIFDYFNPIVVKGNVIADGVVIKIVKKGFDPANKMVWIEDNNGNVQSVYKNALTKIPKGNKQ